MRIAIIGAGAFAKHCVDELPAAGIEVVVLTRSHKDYFDGKNGLVDQRITDYSSVPELVELLSDCDALVGTVFDTTKAYADIHLALLEACKQTPKCKRFIPSEYGGNTEDFVEEPNSVYQYNKVVKDALKAQSEIAWTAVCVGYIVPVSNRYHQDIGPFYPLDLQTKTMTIPGTGNEPFATTAARDIAMETTWLKVAEQMKTTGGMPDLKVVFKSVDELQKIIDQKAPSEDAAIAEYKLYVPLGMLKFDQEKVKHDRDAFFGDVHFRTVQEVLQSVKTDPKIIV